MYTDFLGSLGEVPPNNRVEDTLKYVRPCNQKTDYQEVRFGVPSGTLKFEKHKSECLRLANWSLDHGYGEINIANVNHALRPHLAKFVACLDLWVNTVESRCISEDEIFFRCLTEGPAFADWLKKCRATCFRGKTSETITEVDEEYFIDAYTGYDSILHERYLIHWDDSESIDDVKYAFIPIRNDRSKEFRVLLDEMWSDLRISSCVKYPERFDMLGALKNTKMYDPHSRKTAMMREFWNDDINPEDAWFAKRAVVCTTPASTRDTGIGCPSTILKVKQLNALARAVSDVIPYSANTDGPTCNSRLRRVLRRNAFIHLDFKKFGLTFPRYIMNCIIEKISEDSGLDLDHLLIHNFCVEISGETYRTTRGTMLGWLDAINCIGVCAILHKVTKEVPFDFITFNDDVEISIKTRDAPNMLGLLRGLVISEMDHFDIITSVSKTFGSKGSVFLERYAYCAQYGISMYKDQLTIESFSKSLVTPEAWRAKMLFAAGWLWSKHTYAVDRCIDTCAIEFHKDEITSPLWAGGWFIFVDKDLDMSLPNSSELMIHLGIELSKYRAPMYSRPTEKVSSNDKISNTVNKNCYLASGEAAGRSLFNNENLLEELEDDLKVIYRSCETLAGLCDEGGDLSELILGLVEKRAKERLRPPDCGT